MDNYTEVYTIIEGATDEEIEVDEDGYVIGREGLTYQEWLRELEKEADSEGFVVEVYEIDHSHSPEDAGDCGCVQYLTDHNPSYTFGEEEGE